MAKEASISTNRVTWSPDGSLIGRLFLSKNNNKLFSVSIFIFSPLHFVQVLHSQKICFTCMHSKHRTNYAKFWRYGLNSIYSFWNSRQTQVWIILISFLLFQIDAHTGSVNDIAFSNPNKQLCVVTCGDDKLIKVWPLPILLRCYPELC